MQLLPIASSFKRHYPAHHAASFSQTRSRADFQKMLDHRSVMANSVLGPLAHLQLARTAALSARLARPLQSQRQRQSDACSCHEIAYDPKPKN